MARIILLILLWSGPALAVACGGSGIALQVLGSGGPEAKTERASSSYLVWRGGKALLLVDAGGGAMLRFGESGANMSDLEAIFFTHLHVDHSADFPALVFSSWFEDRTRALPVLGPAGNESMPATTEFVNDLFGPKRGAFRYLSELVSAGEESSYKIEPRNVTFKERGEIQKAFESDDIEAWATPVIHGPVPAIAWRIEIEGYIIAFSGDTNGDNGNLERLARGSDIFVAHNAVPEGATGVERRLHMPPSVIGRIARAAGVKRLVLSHRMLRTLGREAETQAAIAKFYTGPVAFANDLDCFPLAGD